MRVEHKFDFLARDYDSPVPVRQFRPLRPDVFQYAAGVDARKNHPPFATIEI